MKFAYPGFKSVLVGIAALFLSMGAMAQATRTWVSGVGDDANPCSRTAPCKTFAGAISKTADGGIIDVLDPGGFGAVTITKNITIDGSGGSVAGVLVSGTNGINVNGPGIRVTLRNLDIEGIGTGLVGVNFIQGASLTIDRCRIYGFRSGSATGLRVSLGASAMVQVKDTVFLENSNGVFLETTAGTIMATLDNVTIQGATGFGLQTANMGAVNATLKRSTVSNNPGTGIQASGPASVINVLDSLVAGNNTAIYAAYPGAHVRISGNALLDGPTGLVIASGAYIDSDGTSRIGGFGGSFSPNGTFYNR